MQSSLKLVTELATTKIIFSSSVRQTTEVMQFNTGLSVAIASFTYQQLSL
jgi:hypothetical protein